jgi:adenylate cyclase
MGRNIGQPSGRGPERAAKRYSARELNSTIADIYFMNQMIAHTRAQLTRWIRGIGIRQVRLACGLVLFAYLVSHFLNHALGNISMEALAAGVHYHTMFWQFRPVAFVFYGAALVHSSLGIWALYQRRQFRWKAIEPLQLVLGLSIPALIATHIIGARLGQVLFAHEKLYPQELYSFWVAHPYKIWLMSSVLVIAWIHGSIGLYFWLRMKAFFKRAAPFLLAAAVLVPTLALLGFYQGGRSVVADSEDEDWRVNNLSVRQVGTSAQQETLDDIADYFLIGYLGLVGLALLARGVRALNERRAGMIALSYGNGRTIRVPRGFSVLEASLRYNVPHASVCGGRDRVVDHHVVEAVASGPRPAMNLDDRRKTSEIARAIETGDQRRVAGAPEFDVFDIDLMDCAGATGCRHANTLFGILTEYK